MKKNRAVSLIQKQEMRKALLYILPTYTVLFIFIIIPIFFAFFLSFNKWNLLGSMKFVGTANYRKLFELEEFWKALINTFYYSFITVPLGIGISLILALLLNSKIKGLALYRSAY
jgi:multiple sugar transport system permease protein